MPETYVFCLSAIVKVECAVIVALFEGILPSKILSDIRLASIHREKGVYSKMFNIIEKGLYDV